MQPLIALLSLIAFLWLGYTSRHYEEVGYKTSEFDVLKTIKPVGFKARQASALKDVWQLTDADAIKPVQLWK